MLLGSSEWEGLPNTLAYYSSEIKMFKVQADTMVPRDRHHNIRHNDIQHNDTKHNNIQPNGLTGNNH